MAPKKQNKLEPKLPRGFADRGPADIRAVERMMDKIKAVYERYGFEPVETPFVEYTEALGKFLPDQDRPNEGVFSFTDEDENWLSLRYDLTAPLARYVAQNFDALPKPYRSYRAGWVFRNEKPGPGRFRQFMQFDADTVGASSPAADAEICMMAADVMEALGFERGQYVIKVNSRKLLDGVMEAIGLGGEENAGRRLTVLRAIDKLDRLGAEGVRELLGRGRQDESGDFSRGADLPSEGVANVLRFLQEGAAKHEFRERLIELTNAVGLGEESLQAFIKDISPTEDRRENLASRSGLDRTQVNMVMDFFNVAGAAVYHSLDNQDDAEFEITVGDVLFEARSSNERKVLELRHIGIKNTSYSQGLDDLAQIASLLRSAGYGTNRVEIDQSIVRGLEYYTGPVFEAQLTFEVPNEKGEPVVFGSVGGGGRYDGLVGRFRGEEVPATGFSVGVSRLASALKAIGKLGDEDFSGPVVVTVMDRDKLADYQRMVADLRNAGIAAEMYLGSSGMKAQLKYADKRNAPAAIIAGSSEFESGKVQIKDLAAGKQAAANASHQEWRDERPGQFEIPRADLVTEVRRLLARPKGS